MFENFLGILLEGASPKCLGILIKTKLRLDKTEARSLGVLVAGKPRRGCTNNLVGIGVGVAAQLWHLL